MTGSIRGAPAEQVALPVPWSRTATASVALSFVLAGAFSWRDLPPTERWIAVVVPLFGLVLVAVVTRRRAAWLEGTVLGTRLLRTRQADLNDARRIDLVRTRAGAVMLRVEGRQTVHYALAVRSALVDAQAPPWVLDALAERLASSCAPGAGQARSLLERSFRAP